MTTDDIQELEFLRFFYERARYAMGPADDDIYQAIKDEFRDENGYIPYGYGSDD